MRSDDGALSLADNKGERVIPFVGGEPRFDACLVTGLPSFARTSYGAVKNPTFSAAKFGSRRVINTAEHMTLA
jgi:hypothetical protein